MDEEGTQDALAKELTMESERFRAIYIWLKASMTNEFFDEVDVDSCYLITHSLVGFERQEYFSQINLSSHSFVLSQDSADSDLKIFKLYQDRQILYMRTFVSKFPMPEKAICLRITLLYFEGGEARFWQGVKGEQKVGLEMLLEKAKSSDLTQVEAARSKSWSKEAGVSLELKLACSSVPFKYFVPRLLHVIHSRHLAIRNFCLAFIEPESASRFLVMTAELHGKHGEDCWECTDIEAMIRELGAVRDFVQDDIFERAFMSDRQNVHFLRAASRFVEQSLFHIDPHMYSLDNIQEAICYWPEIANSLYELFCLKCDPWRSNIGVYEKNREILLELISKQDTGKEIADERRKTSLSFVMLFIDSILKTNFFVSPKGAIAFRLNSKFLKDLPFPKHPFGIFYLYQRDFFGFHIRFQDLARGGLRTVMLSSGIKEEAPLVFQECYQLALTQQKKNKDIPEGGAKGILFLFPGQEKVNHLYRSQRLFIESLLMLVNAKEDGALRQKDIVDYYGKPEYLYFGPDENMHDSMIEWIAKCAKDAGYKPGIAFITSKPRYGINHKQYGVTSLGVNVCMHEVLQELGINPETSRFTVKMAGGPDGDVAGNEILNLEKYYPNTAKLITLIDISGVIYDPMGLDLKVMKELFSESKSIRFYPTKKLSEGGFLLDMRQERHEGVHIVQYLIYKIIGGKVVEEWLTASAAHEIRRNFVHKTEADVFIPAGGRPSTLCEANLKDFFTAQGVPTAKAIIEGANLYITPQARLALEDKGVIIIKDSSANKGGVICSSFEVLSSLTLTKDEFLEHKEEIVQEILQKISKYAQDEVRLILKTHKKTGEPCTKISEKISEKIDHFSTHIRDYLEPLILGADPILACFYEYVLPILRTHFHDRLLNAIPDVHKKAIVASWIASQVVYLRGLDWSPSIVDVLPFLIQDPTITSCPIR